MTDPRELATYLDDGGDLRSVAYGSRAWSRRGEIRAALERLAEVERDLAAEREGNEVKHLLLEVGANMHAEDTARIQKLEAALRRWFCRRCTETSCGVPDGFSCGNCAGSFLHPIAAEALKADTLTKPQGLVEALQKIASVIGPQHEYCRQVAAEALGMARAKEEP